MTTRVVIVDDDVWIRSGRAHALGEVPGIEVTANLGHAEALDRPDWDGVDVALVDAWDRRAGFDRFPGVGVVRAIRRHDGVPPVRIVIITGHVVNDMLRLRMAEAGADLFYGHEDVAERDALAAVVLAACDDDTTLLTDTGRKRPNPDAALAWIRDHEMDAAFSGEPQKLIPFSRRTVIRIRREVSTRAGLATNYKLPPWRQVVAFVNRARGAELRRPDEADRARPD